MPAGPHPRQVRRADGAQMSHQRRLSLPWCPPQTPRLLSRRSDNSLSLQTKLFQMPGSLNRFSANSSWIIFRSLQFRGKSLSLDEKYQILKKIFGFCWRKLKIFCAPRWPSTVRITYLSYSIHLGKNINVKSHSKVFNLSCINVRQYC